MILPLGLGYRWMKIPLITILIIVINVISFTDFQSRHQKIENEINSIAEKTAYKNTELNLFKEFCNKQLQAQICTSSVEHLNGNKQELKPIIPALKLYLTFKRSLLKEAIKFKELAAYSSYEVSHEQFSKNFKEVSQRENLLSKYNINLENIFSAQFQHAGWEHLISNMILLLLFGAYVEFRAGLVFFIFTYLFGGLVGLSAEMFQSTNSNYFLLGASANVYAIVGAFFIYFYNSRMRMYIFPFFKMEAMYIPVKIFVPIVFVLNELFYAFNSFSNVAHIAHLSGFAVGCFLSIIFNLVSRVPQGFIYEEEFALWKSASNQADIKKNVENYSTILKWNPENKMVRNYAIKKIFNEIKYANNASITNKRFLDKYLSSEIADSFQFGRKQDLLMLATSVPKQVSANHLFSSLPDSALFEIYKLCRLEGEKFISLKYLDAYLCRKPNVKNINQIIVAANDLLLELLESCQSHQEIVDFPVKLESEALSQFYSDFINDRTMVA